ncbi:type VI secretion system tip protein VgrG, partial [Halarcobacter ebronensis]
TLEATSGISLRCGGNVATVDSSGIHFNTPNYVKNSGENGVDGTEVRYTGDIINLRADDTNRVFLSEVIEDDYILRADTSLKEGTSVEATCFILGEDEEILAQETKSINVKNSRLEAVFDLDGIIASNKISETKIKEVKGKYKWES